MTFKSTLLQSRIKTKWTFKSQIESISSCLYARLLNFLITIYTSGSKQPFISLISLLLRLVRHRFISFLLDNSIQSPVIPNQPLFYPTYFAIFWTWKHLPTTQKKTYLPGYVVECQDDSVLKSVECTLSGLQSCCSPEPSLSLHHQPLVCNALFELQSPCDIESERLIERVMHKRPLLAPYCIIHIWALVFHQQQQCMFLQGKW